MIGVLLLAAAAFGLTGCSKPSGVDGNLINGWPMPAEPKVPVPEAPACYDLQAEDPTEVPKWPAPVDCSDGHYVETIHVGQFTGADAERGSPPLLGSDGRRRAYAECSAAAEAYLGADWRTGRMQLFLVPPSETYWDAGARWYRCDVLEYQDLTDFAVAERTGAIKGALAPGSSLLLTCMEVTASGDTVEKILPVDCSSPHNGEFTGVYDHPDGDYPTDATARGKANLSGCRGVVAAYVGIPNDDAFQSRVGQVSTAFSNADWELGNRGVRCFVWLPKNVKVSVKGAGPRGLPSNAG